MGFGVLAAVLVGGAYALPPTDMPLNRKDALARIKGSARRSLLFSSLPDTSDAAECATDCPSMETGVEFVGDGKADIFRHLSIAEMDEVGDFLVFSGIADVKVRQRAPRMSHYRRASPPQAPATGARCTRVHS